MPVSVAARRPSAPSSPSSRTSYSTSSYSTARYSSLSRSTVTSLDLSRSYLSDRLSSSSLSARPVRHGSHSEDVLSRYSTSRERSTEPSRASSSSLCDSTSTAARREREGSVTKTRLGLDAASTTAAVASSRLDAPRSAYSGASSGKLGRPPLHSALSSSASSADDSAASASARAGSTAAASTYTRSRTTPTTAATMTTSTGKPFHSRFLKPKPAPEDKDKASTTSASEKAGSSDKELVRDEDDARNNNSIRTGATDNGSEDADDDDNGNESHRRPSVALLRQRFDAAAPNAVAVAANATPPCSNPATAPTPAAPDGKHQEGGHSRVREDGAGLGHGGAERAERAEPPLAGGHEEVAAGAGRHQRLSASPSPSAPSAPSDPDNFESPRLGRRAPSTANGTRGSGLNGLRNIGNTCFMNSVIQCLSNTRPLLEYLLKQTYLAEINTTNSSMKGALIKAFAKMIEELWTGENQVINTSAFKGQIQHFAPRFMGYSQQDAQEFLRYLLEGLHEDVNRVEQRPTNTVLPDIDDSLNDNQKADESWRRYLRIDNSSVLDVFVGQLKSTLQCTTCGHCSVTFDPFWDLSLPIPSRTGQLRLQQCLEHFTREEVLDGDEKPTCAKCQTRRKCTKSFSIQKFPKILVLHLKRFSPMERFRGKLNVTVEFPLNGLDLSAYAANRGRGCTYNLYGIANHSGTTYSGHYTAYCKHPYTHEWHEYNDSRVSGITSRNVVSSEAYVLFYELSGHTSHL